jgi:MFS superfamily sulfate permease-like transporter
MNDALTWDGNWAWSLPLVMLTVIFHVIGLGLFNVQMIRLEEKIEGRRRYEATFVIVMGVTTVWTTILIGIEAGVWATAYRILGAIPDSRTAMLYSLSAITTYGYSEIFLAEHWRLMGALEALNGIMLFGLTTAFMYGMIQRVWPLERRRGYTPTHH